MDDQRWPRGRGIGDVQHRARARVAGYYRYHVIRQMRSAGHSLREIGDYFLISGERVRQILKRGAVAAQLTLLGTVMLLVLPALAADLPDPTRTPGVANPVLTKAVVCKKGFRTGKYRNVDADTKAKVCLSYGLSAHCDAREAYEIDHLIDIDNGGGNDIANLWPQSCSGPWNCHDKDKLELKLHQLVCSGKLDFAAAQRAIAMNWKTAYAKYFDQVPRSAGGKKP